MIPNSSPVLKKGCEPDFNSPFISQRDDGSGDLRIKNAQVWHEGRYTCTAQTVVDSDVAYADLKVVGLYWHRKSSPS